MENKSNWTPDSNSVADNYKNLNSVPTPQSTAKRVKKHISKSSTESVTKIIREEPRAPVSAERHGTADQSDAGVSNSVHDAGLISDIDESNILMSRVFPRLNTEYALNSNRKTEEPTSAPAQTAQVADATRISDAAPRAIPVTPMPRLAAERTSAPAAVPTSAESRASGLSPRAIPVTPMPRAASPLPQAAPPPHTPQPQVSPPLQTPPLACIQSVSVSAFAPRDSGVPRGPKTAFPTNLNSAVTPETHGGPVEPKLCFGEHSSKHIAMIKNYIYDELSDYKYYIALSRKTRSKTAAVLKRIAADEERHAKRLSTAYNLITGDTYYPTDKVLTPVILSASDSLRGRFRDERAGAEKYMDAANAASDDNCLSDLFKELAADEERHAREIWDLTNPK